MRRSCAESMISYTISKGGSHVILFAAPFLFNILGDNKNIIKSIHNDKCRSLGVAYFTSMRS